jgi:hypothetical protein
VLRAQRLASPTESIKRLLNSNVGVYFGAERKGLGGDEYSWEVKNDFAKSISNLRNKILWADPKDPLTKTNRSATGTNRTL